MINLRIKPLSLLLLMLMFSCATTEEIWINPDGTIRTETKMDMSSMMALMQLGNAMEDEEEDSEMEDEDDYEEELEEGVEDDDMEDMAEESSEGFDKMMDNLFTQENVDTLIDFRDIIKEEILDKGVSEEEFLRELTEDEDLKKQGIDPKALLKTLTNSQMRIKIDKDASVAFMSLIQTYDQAKDFSVGMNFMQIMSSIMQSSRGEEASEDPMDEMMSRVMVGSASSYDLQKRQLRISRPAVDYSDLPEESLQQLQMMQMFLGDSGHRIIVHVPKKVKKVSVDDATIDKSTVTIEVPTAKIGEKGEDFEVVVKFK